MNIISLSQRLLNIKAKPIALFLPIVLYLSACSSLDQGGLRFTVAISTGLSRLFF